MITKNRFIAAMVLANMLVFSQSGHAGILSGSYSGSIDSDAGLGLIGQTMQVDFSYDDSIAPYSTLANGSSSYSGFLQNLSISIGSNTWNWDSVNGYADITLYDNDLIVFSQGIEDRISLFVGAFTGPDLVAGPVDNYSFELYLHDILPLDNPDGLTADTQLPTQAPDANLFDQGNMQNTMQFSFVAGDPETGDYYLISTANVTNASPVPIPPAAWLFASTLLGLCGIGRRDQLVAA